MNKFLALLLLVVSTSVVSQELCFNSVRIVGYFPTDPVTQTNPSPSTIENFNVFLGTPQKMTDGTRVYPVTGTVRNLNNDVSPVAGTAISNQLGWRFTIQSTLIVKSASIIGNFPRAMYAARGIVEVWEFGPRFTNGLSRRYNRLLNVDELYGMEPSIYNRFSDVSDNTMTPISCY